MKQWMLVGAVCLGVSALGDLAERKALAAELLEAMGGEQQSIEMRNQREKMADDVGRILNPDSEGAIKEVEKELGVKLDPLREASDWEHHRRDFIKVYSELYSEDELEALIAFYISPIGKKVVANGPEVSRRMTELKMVRLKPVLEAQKKAIDGKVEQSSSEVKQYNFNPTQFNFIVPEHVEVSGQGGVYNLKWKNDGRGFSTLFLMADTFIVSKDEFDASADENISELSLMLEQRGIDAEQVKSTKCRYGSFEGTEILYSLKMGGGEQTAHVLYLWDGGTAWKGMVMLDDAEDYIKVQEWLGSAQKINVE